MRKEETVSSGQMACLFLSFMLGSSLINMPQPLADAAGNGAWLSVIIGNGYGIFLLACVYYLYRKNPDLTFIDYSRKMLGKWVTLCISIPIILLLLLMLSNIVVDIGGFLTNAMMRETPPYVFHSLILLVSAMTARSGIEVMTRMFVMLLIYMVLFSVTVLILSIPFYQVGNLLPVFPDGMKPVIHGSYLVLGFPYSELVLFSLILPFVRKEKNNSLKKYMFLVLLIQGFMFVISVVCSIMALGPLASTFKFSVFQLARLINIREIITRIESFIGIALIVGSYMKASITLFILKETLSRVFKLHDERIIIFPVSFVALLLSLTMYKSEIEHAEIVLVVWPLFITIVAVLPLIFITLITLLKGKKIKSKDT
ncbi:GerAB/ArcD/ProY family transporter [Metabacillus arenae]|uniref:Endospore germination permease n=1 Tax=Metabacillus arenae TaxID=2771434 RepID=A0A926NDZ1_9BACI|nr:endospore germination permease [Metabacillus arenae]MBD1379390.1 endospore germination permease [Metabacillus arenae]